MKIIKIKSNGPGEFESVVARILKQNKYILSQYDSPQRNFDRGFDFEARFGEVLWFIELKLYRTRRAQLPLIETAAIRLSAVLDTYESAKGMLIVSSELNPEARIMLEEKYNIAFVDRIDLVILASAESELASELAAILEQRPNETYDRSREELERSIRKVVNSEAVHIDAEEPSIDGELLCRRLRELPGGRQHFRKHEGLCTEILSYLFDLNLNGWHE